MNKTKRQIYIDLTELVHRGLCNCCKFAEWEGWSCCEMDMTCTHPLEGRLGFPDPVDSWQGCDCWAFRPAQSPSEVAAWVGIILEGNIPDRDNNGELIAVIPNK